MKFNNILLITTDESDIKDIKDALIEHDVLVCSHPDEALQLSSEHDIYLVIVEEELPGGSGSDLFGELRKQRPWLGGLLISEKADEKMLRRALDIGFSGVIEKPIEPIRLLQRIFKAMDTATMQEEDTRLKTILPLYGFGEQFLNATTDQKIFESLLQVVYVVTVASKISVMWYAEEEDRLQIVAQRGLDPELAKSIKLKPGEQIAGWVFQNGKPVILNRDSQEKSVFAPLLQRQEITAAVSYPITMHGKVLGVLNISHQSDDAKFNESDIEMLAVICAQASMALANVRYRSAMEEKTKMRTIFQQYVSPEVAELLISSGTDLVGLGEIKKVTIFFADIRESTTLVQLLPLEELRAFLNAFFHIFTEGIFQNKGTVDKFMGDAVLAVFGAPVELENPNLAAITAAIDVRKGFLDLKREWIARREEFKLIDLAVGLACGEVFVGNVGSSNRFDYTVIGTPVNIACRIAAASPSGAIHVTGEVRKEIREDFETSEVGTMRLRGVQNSVPVFVVGNEITSDVEE